MAAPEFATLTADDLVTGEAVALDLPPASLGVRLASGLIDVTVTLALLLVVIMTFLIAALPTDDALAHVALVGTLVVVFLVFPTTSETLSRGKSLGKWAFGLRAVRDDAGPISFQHAFVRALVGVVEIYLFLGSPAFFSVLLSSRGQASRRLRRGHVRRTRAGPAQPRAPAADADRARAWARAADVAALPTGLALAVRQFLQRSPGLDPASPGHGRQHASRSRSRRTSPHHRRAGTPPEAFLAAVIATRRERDEARLGRERAFRERLTARRG